MNATKMRKSTRLWSRRFKCLLLGHRTQQIVAHTNPYRFVVCTRCGAIRTHPKPDDDAKVPDSYWGNGGE